MKIYLLLLLLAHVSPVLGQINMQDSTVQAITYWSKGERQSYRIESLKVKANAVDTVLLEHRIDDVEITVLQETKKSYTIEWRYKSNDTRVQNPDLEKMMYDVEDEFRIVYRTDENGIFEELTNWREVKSQFERGLKKWVERNRHLPRVEEAYELAKKTYLDQGKLAFYFLKPIVQFHHFYGFKYKLGRKFDVYPEEAASSSENAPASVKSQRMLMDIYPDKSYFRLESLTEVTLAPPQEVTKKAHGEAIPKDKPLDKIVNMVILRSLMHESGWVIESDFTSVVSSSDETIMYMQKIRLK